MAARYVAGASGLPFGVLRGYVGTDLMDHTPTLAPITCPFTGEQLTAVPALNPDVAVIHAQQADRRGNVQLWGLVGVQKEAVLAARRSIVTVEEVVDELTPRPNAVVLPAWVVGAVCEVPGGAHPSFAIGYSSRDNEFYRAWDDISRDRATFTAWIDEHVRGTADFGEYLASLRARSRRWPVPERQRRRRDDRQRGSLPRATISPASSASACRRPPPTWPGGCTPRTACSIYESGCIGSKPTRLPLSIGDGELAETVRRRGAACPRSSPTGCRPGASTSASSAPRSSTGSATSTRP